MDVLLERRDKRGFHRSLVTRKISEDAGQYFCAKSVVQSMYTVNILSISKTTSVKVTSRYICTAAADVPCTPLNTVPPHLNIFSQKHLIITPKAVSPLPGLGNLLALCAGHHTTVSHHSRIL
jgi:hypothetical protein